MLIDFYQDLHHYLQSTIILLLSFLVGYLVRVVFFRIIAPGADESKDLWTRSVYRRTRGAWFIFLPLILFLFLLPRDKFDEDILQILVKFTESVIILSFANIAVRAIYVVEDFLIQKYDITKSDNVKERKIRTQLSFVKRVLIIVIVTITVSAILLNIEGVRKYGAALITSAGVVGIIIGFAAQKSLANLLAGLQIAFTQPIKIDDVVIVENEWGWIEEINLTYVVVKIWDLRRLVVPITYFVEKPFQNWTRVTADLLGSVFLYVDYTTPLDELRNKFEEILEASPLWDKKVKVLQVTDSTERCMQIRFLMSARNSPQAWDLRCEVREKMISFIQKHYPESLPHIRAEVSELPQKNAGSTGNQ